MSATDSIEELRRRNAELEAELLRLRSGFFTPSGARTVIVPESMRPLFDAAQETVHRYFQDAAADPAQGMIEVAGERYVLIRASALSIDFLSAIFHLYADRDPREALSIGQSFLFDIAHTVGISDARSFHQKMGLRDPIAKLSAGPVHFAYCGWALVDIKPESSPTPDEDFVLVYDHPYSFEAASWLKADRRSDCPVCIMNAGYSSGWCEESFGVELTAVEVLCRAKGDPTCTFIMAPPHRIAGRIRERFGTEVQSPETKGLSIPSYFDRKRVDQALKDSAARFAALFDHMTSGVAVYQAIEEGRDFVFQDFNRAAERIDRRSREEVLGRRVTEIFPGVEAVGLLEVMRRVWRTGQPEYHPAAYYRDDRIAGWRENHVSRLPGGEVVAVYDDVTEKKKAEQARMESEERYRVLAEAAQDFIFVITPEMRVEYANPAARKLFGATSAEVVGRPIRSLFPPAIAERVTHTLQQVFASGEPWMGEDRYLFPSGEMWQSVRLAPIRNEAGQVTGVLGAARDITEQKQLQGRLAQTDRLASVGMLAAGVAHEINNPLSFVLYNLESLLEDVSKLSQGMGRLGARMAERLGSEETMQLLGTLSGFVDPGMLSDMVDRLTQAAAGARRVGTIVRDLKTFSRVEEDRRDVVLVNQVLESAINMAFNEIKYRARLVKDYGNVPFVEASEGRLSQVFLNLLVNAAQAIGEGSADRNEIRVRTWAEKDAVLVSVQDTGSGIPAAHLERLFDPFFTTKPVGVGSGVGLSICHNIVSALGGTIEVESEVGQGSRFTVRLPLPKTGTAPGTPAVVVRDGAPEAPKATSRRRGRILIVDDEPFVGAAIKRMLRAQHEVVTVMSGQEAQEILEKDPAFDLIICDLMMPMLSGMDLHAWLADRSPGLARRMLFISGGAFTPRAQAFLDSVSNLRLEKPLDAQITRMLVDRLVNESE